METRGWISHADTQQSKYHLKTDRYTVYDDAKNQMLEAMRTAQGAIATGDFDDVSAADAMDLAAAWQEDSSSLLASVEAAAAKAEEEQQEQQAIQDEMDAVAEEAEQEVADKKEAAKSERKERLQVRRLEAEKNKKWNVGGIAMSKGVAIAVLVVIFGSIAGVLAYFHYTDPKRKVGTGGQDENGDGDGDDL